MMSDLPVRNFSGRFFRCPFRRSERAVALPLVLWAVFVVSTVVVVTLRLVAFDIDLEARASKRFVARQAALTGLAFAMHPKVLRADPLLIQTLPDGSKFEVTMESEDARLNINKLLADKNSTVLRDLFRLWGLNDKDVSIAVDSLRDWVDGDELRGLNGAEAADLEGQDFSIPENRPFLRVSEMERVRGMDAVIRAKPDWKNYFSVRSSNVLDLQDVSPDLLRVVGHIGPDQARTIVEYRNGGDRLPNTKDDQIIKSTADVSHIISLPATQATAFQTFFGTGSNLRRIVSRGSVGGVTYEIDVIAAVGAQSSSSQPAFMEWLEK
jgi:general secretion pathway protein K